MGHLLLVDCPNVNQPVPPIDLAQFEPDASPLRDYRVTACGDGWLPLSVS